MMPAKQDAQAQAKQQAARQKGETVRIQIKNVQIRDVAVIVQLPDDMSKMQELAQQMNQSQQNQTATSMDDSSMAGQAGAQAQPNYRLTIEEMHIDKWAFIVGTDRTPDKTMTFGDFSMKDRVIRPGQMAAGNQQSMDSSNQQSMSSSSMMAGMGSSSGMSSMDASTYCILIKDVHIENVTFLFGNAEMPDTPEESEPPKDDDSTETTTDCNCEDGSGEGGMDTTSTAAEESSDATTTTEDSSSETTTTADSSESGDSESSTEESSSGDTDSSDESTTNSNGQPGFGVAVSLIAILSAAFLARRY
jgi:PGF-CTERM protein